MELFSFLLLVVFQLLSPILVLHMLQFVPFLFNFWLKFVLPASKQVRKFLALFFNVEKLCVDVWFRKTVVASFCELVLRICITVLTIALLSVREYRRVFLKEEVQTRDFAPQR